jgi:hypothetical protein
MAKTGNIKNNKVQYKKIAWSLIKTRPMLHIISAATTMTFLIIWLLSRDFAADFINKNPALSYVIVAVPSLIGSFYFEKLISDVIDSLGMMLAHWKDSKRLTILIMAIALPLMFVGGATSFIGIGGVSSGAADATSLSESNAVHKEIATADKAADKVFKAEKAELKAERKDLRKSFEAEKVAKLKAVPVKNGDQWDKRAWNDYHKKQYATENSVDSSKIETEYSNTLLQFDQETADLVAAKETDHNDDKDSDRKLLEKKLGNTEAVNTRHVTRIEWLGNLFGFFAVVALFMSVCASVASHFICAELSDPTANKIVTPETIAAEMKPKRKKGLFETFLSKKK